MHRKSVKQIKANCIIKRSIVQRIVQFVITSICKRKSLIKIKASTRGEKKKSTNRGASHDEQKMEMNRWQHVLVMPLFSNFLDFTHCWRFSVINGKIGVKSDDASACDTINSPDTHDKWNCLQKRFLRHIVGRRLRIANKHFHAHWRMCALCRVGFSV